MNIIKDTRDGLILDTQESRKKSNELLVKYLFDLIEKISPSCSFEIGAFSAEFSRNLKSKYPNIKTYAFEANPHNYKYFLNKFSFKEINYINKAVSDTNNIIEFNIQKNVRGVDVSPIRGNNSILQKNASNITYDKIQIPSIVLSDFIRENNLINEKIIMWIDVEGASEQVLKGCEKMLDLVSLIFIEVEDIVFWKNQWTEENVYRFLTEKGFTLIGRDGEYPKQYNQIYIKNE